MTHKQKTVLQRWLRVLCATVAANLIVALSVPNALQAIQADPQAFVTVNLLIPTLTAMEKYLRYGGDPGELNDAVEGDNSEIS